jgi:hypothetical protein
MNKSRRVYSGRTGKVAEIRFRRAAESLGLLVKKSSHTEDMHQHIDFWLATTKDGKKWGVDVKGNNLPDEIWCEFKNVKGKPGWMYGNAHIIAFDMPEEGGFSVVDRQELAFWCEKHVRDIFVKDKKDAHLKKYTRRDRLDVITRLNLEDIKLLQSYRVWPYETDY